MKKNKTHSILFFLLFVIFILLIPLFFLKKRESFLAPGTQEGGARWDGKIWSYISRNRSKIPEIDLNTEGAILGEMNNLHLLPSSIQNNLKGDSYKRSLMQVQRVTRPPPPKVNPFVYPRNPFQILKPQVVQKPNPFQPQVIQTTKPQVIQTTKPQVIQTTQPQVIQTTKPQVIQKPVPFQKSSNTWNKFFRR
jgi:hypothetical protein